MALNWAKQNARDRMRDRGTDDIRGADVPFVRWPTASTPRRPRPRPPSKAELRAEASAAADRAPVDFSDLLLTPGVGARTVRASAMVAEVVHGAPYRFTDPARFSFAHGGKDRHPFPVPLRYTTKRYAC